MSAKSVNQPTSGLSIASLILGIISFLPGIGLLLGIIAIVLGFVAVSQIKKGTMGGKGMARAGIILGILGICFTILVYGLLFYVVFGSKSGPFAGMKNQLSNQLLTQDEGYIELYKNKYGKYPPSLEVLSKDGYAVFPTDHYMKPFFYKVSADGKSYDLRSLGADGKYGTPDDIFPLK